jgi:hypothetical protein
LRPSVQIGGAEIAMAVVSQQLVGPIKIGDKGVEVGVARAAETSTSYGFFRTSSCDLTLLFGGGSCSTRRHAPCRSLKGEKPG